MQKNSVLWLAIKITLFINRPIVFTTRSIKLHTNPHSTNDKQMKFTKYSLRSTCKCSPSNDCHLVRCRLQSKVESNSDPSQFPSQELFIGSLHAVTPQLASIHITYLWCTVWEKLYIYNLECLTERTHWQSAFLQRI